MERAIFKHLKTWLLNEQRKPLVIRGARQVGKTWIVRFLASSCSKKLIELNFEKNPSYATLFESNDPAEILINISTVIKETIIPNQSILFLDEIQAAPELLSKLRWFAEDMPDLPVIATGSLLDFVLQDHTFSMPVGRISYMHLEPFSFEEFLLAQQEVPLYEYIQAYTFKNSIPKPIHEKLNGIFREYMLVGGLPASVNCWVQEHSLIRVNEVLNDLLATYRDDFAKFKSRLSIEKIDEIMMAIPRMLGRKFVFAQANKDAHPNTVKNILDLLRKARLSHQIAACSANGLPLASEIRDKYFKEILLDVGLVCTALGLNLNRIQSIDELVLINKGGLAEQIVGQLLRTILPPYIEPALYYWLRDEKGSSAEIDYIIQHRNFIVPIEVKAGSSGSLKSLHLFIALKKLDLALRINADFPSVTELNLKDQIGNPASYTLLSIPFYLTGQIPRLLDSIYV